ncbi:Major facilitator superfamily MFS_1 [Thermus sp. CCB_US3_UF1]|uniref:MFS transporter n=1 Tax=Thermus sp. CCB_US3_UF1 TaxID=1111069 RepID=UPI000238A3C6|nr:MFS transporter [Thermus sp. CCB_US3_UF1]AEV15737.1 Major facilitator superfamily MFS_1 [Thermus sp. CCB_US3_UF1]
MLALALLKDPLYRPYWLALFTSQMGTWMQSAAQGWLVLLLTGSAERLGLVVALQFLPSLLFSLPAGVLADRYPKRNLLLLTQGGMMLLALLMGLLILTGWVRYGHVLLFAFLYGALNAMDLPVRQSFTVELAGRERYPGAIALNSFGFNTSRLLGPALSGFLIALFGVGVAYLANALSFLPLLLVLRRVPPGPRGEGDGRWWREAQEGVRFVLEHPLVRRVVGLVLFASLLGMNFQTLVPAYARLVLGLSATGYGFLVSSVGLGALGAALVMAFTGRPKPVRLLLGVFLLALAHLGLFLPKPALAPLFLALGGFGMISVLINANTLVQLSVPDRLRGRVMAVYSLVMLGTGPLGAYLTGLLFEALGGRWAALALGGVVLLVGLYQLRPWPKGPSPPA